MKQKIVKIILTFWVAAFVLSGCEMIFDNDTTDNKSLVSTKPVVTLVGEPIMELLLGGSYIEEGIIAHAADTLLDYEIIQGNVRPDSLGFYVVTYEAVNGFGWSTKAYRAVLVHDGDPYGDDISGIQYTAGNSIGDGHFQYESVIMKHPINGYWEMSNVFIQDGANVPIVFADKGDGTYGVVPQDHATKGFYYGNGYKSGANKIVFEMYFIVKGISKPVYKKFTWTRRG